MTLRPDELTAAIDRTKAQLDRLLEQADALLSTPADTYPAGEVIQFKLVFPGASIAYQYVAVKCEDPPNRTRPWFLSGKRGIWLTWGELWTKLSSRHAGDVWWASAWEPVEGLG